MPLSFTGYRRQIGPLYEGVCVQYNKISKTLQLLEGRDSKMNNDYYKCFIFELNDIVYNFSNARAKCQTISEI